MSAAVVWRLGEHGIEPVSNRLRAVLRLPKLVRVRVPPCACGEVHVAKRCPHTRRKPARPRRQWKREALTLAGVVVWLTRERLTE